MSASKHLLSKFLSLDPPWEVQDVRFDDVSRRCDVWIGSRSSLLSFKKPSATTGEIWQHLSLADHQLWIHAALPPDADTASLPWVGDHGMPFTHAMSQQIFTLLDEGTTLAGICQALNVSLKNLWKYKFALDHGRVDKQGLRLPGADPAAPERSSRSTEARAAPGAQTRGAPRSTAPPSIPSERTTAVPDVSDPVWEDLAQGRLALDIRLLGLKLLLNRVRTQFIAIDDDDVRMLKLRELHRFFVRNSRLLRYELTQLNRLAA